MDEIMFERFEKALYSKGFTEGYLKGAADQTTKNTDDFKRQSKVLLTCWIAGTAVGVYLGEKVKDYLEKNHVRELTGEWVAEKREKIKNKFTRKKNKKH